MDTPVTQAILPVAGLGTRFLPWTKVVPKELLPLGNRPMIAVVVDECLDAGITDLCFVISQGKEPILKYFERDITLEKELSKRGKCEMLSELERYDNVKFTKIYQDEQLGDGHALLQAADWVDSDQIAVLFGDDLFVGEESGLTQLLTASKDIDSPYTIVALEQLTDDQIPTKGIVECRDEEDLKRINSIVEKPTLADAPSNLGIVGRYIIPASTFEILPSVSGSVGGEIRLVDALVKQLSDIPTYGKLCSGQRIDTGNPEGYRHALDVCGC